jgi:hypothetical protein
MKMYGGMEIQHYALLILAVKSSVVRFMLQSPYSCGKNPGSHWIRGWMTLRHGLNRGPKRKVSAIARSQMPVIQLVTTVTKLVHIKIKTNYKQFTDLVAEKLHL